MVGGGNRRDEGSLVINSNNVFAALGSLKKKKKSDKVQGSSKGKGSSKATGKEPVPQVFWAPAPLTAKSWADVDDEDDDDYYATTAPPQSVWGPTQQQPKVEESSTFLEESDNEGLDDLDDEGEEDHEPEPEAPVVTASGIEKAPETIVAPKDTERQLSKKQLRKKGLEELDAVLEELGFPKPEASKQDESHGTQEKKENQNGEAEKKENAPGESKTAKKKKKKDKSSKEVKESQEQQLKEPQTQSNEREARNGTDESAGTEKADDTPVTDIKERLKKVASVKKKKSAKDMDAAARAAANEAALRNARLAAAKKKEKSHYNQQPVR